MTGLDVLDTVFRPEHSDFELGEQYMQTGVAGTIPRNVMMDPAMFMMMIGQTT